MIVLDASAVIELVLSKPAADVIRRRLLWAKETLHAPHLLDLEVIQVVRRHLSKGEIDLLRAEIALADFADLPIVRYPHGRNLPRIWELRNNLTAYDAAYVALAEMLDAPLLTCDRRLASAAGHHARVDLI